MEMNTLEKKIDRNVTYFFLKGAQIYCEDHPGKTTEGNVRAGGEKKVQGKIAD